MIVEYQFPEHKYPEYNTPESTGKDSASYMCISFHITHTIAKIMIVNETLCPLTKRIYKNRMMMTIFMYSPHSNLTKITCLLCSICEEPVFEVGKKNAFITNHQVPYL